MYKKIFNNYFKSLNLYFSISFLLFLFLFYIIIFIEKIFHLNILNNYLPNYLNYMRVDFFYEPILYFGIFIVIFIISLLIEKTDYRLNINFLIKALSLIYIIFFTVIYLGINNNLFFKLNYNNLLPEQQIKIKEITKSKFINEKLFIYEDIINKDLNETNLKKYNECTYNKNNNFNRVYLKIIGNEIYLDLFFTAKKEKEFEKSKEIFNRKEINFILNQFFKSNEKLIKYYNIRKKIYEN